MGGILCATGGAFGYAVFRRLRRRRTRRCLGHVNMGLILMDGAEIGLGGCLELAQVLKRMTLRVPGTCEQLEGKTRKLVCPMTKPRRS